MTVATFLGTTSSSGGVFGTSVAAALQFFAASQCLLQEPWPLQTTVQNGTSYDFIVVGGGTAGSTLAARLSEMDASVLLVEAGGDPPQESIIPVFKDVLKNSPFDWNFTTVNDYVSSQALRNGVQKQPRGKMLGGSGSLNDMVYARGFPVDYDEWASIVGEEWKWPTVLKYFKKTEHLTDEIIINNPKLMEYHAVGGEIEVARLNISTFTTDIFLEAFSELGFRMVQDMTNPESIGAGRFSHTIRDGHRDGSLTGLLNKAAVERDNLHTLKNALATKILIHNNTAYGIQVLIDEEIFQFYANKEVILTAGTFNTAKLLLLSGIGPKDHLESLNIDVVEDVPVGENLHDHVMMLNYLVADNGTCVSDEGTLYFELIRYLYDRTGFFSRTNSMGAYVSLKGSTETNVPDFAIYPSCVAAGSFGGCLDILGFEDSICSELNDFNQDRELINLAVVLLKPKSRGKVKLKSKDPLDELLIYSGTFSDADDLDGFPEVIDIARSLANSSYFRSKNATIINLKIAGCEGVADLDKIKCQAKALSTSAWHAVGTTAMGTVLDSRLKVFGIDKLRVADASIMPKVVRGNTNAPVVMIAERAADFIKEDFGYL